MKLRICAGLLGLGLWAGTASALELKFDAGNSSLKFTADYGGEPIEGQFRQFSGTVQFDPANPLQSRFQVQVQVESVDSDDDERDGYLRGSEWFASKSHPQAEFVTSQDCSSFEGRLSCAGQLTLKGKTAPVTIEVQFAGDGSKLTGSAQVSRLTFGIGEGEWADPEAIGDAVQLQFELGLKPAG